MRNIPVRLLSHKNWAFCKNYFFVYMISEIYTCGGNLVQSHHIWHKTDTVYRCRSRFRGLCWRHHIDIKCCCGRNININWCCGTLHHRPIWWAARPGWWHHFTPAGSDYVKCHIIQRCISGGRWHGGVWRNVGGHCGGDVIYQFHLTELACEFGCTCADGIGNSLMSNCWECNTRGPILTGDIMAGISWKF